MSLPTSFRIILATVSPYVLLHKFYIQFVNFNKKDYRDFD